MTSVSVDISVDTNDKLWSINGQFDVKKTVIVGRSGLPGAHIKDFNGKIVVAWIPFMSYSLFRQFWYFGWPPRTLHLSTCDVFLWGCLKSRAYISKPRTLAKLWANIRLEIRAISKKLGNACTKTSRKTRGLYWKLRPSLTMVLFTKNKL